jgi:ABC-type glycerol-3-phosphate transport system substrate-binding protein
MKSYFILVLALVSALALVACGGAAAQPTATASAPAAPTTAATSAPSQPAAGATAAATSATGSGNAVQIAFWHGQSGPQETAMKGLVDQFNASHPDIKVTATFQGNYSDLYKKVTAALAANAPPDLAVAYQNDVSNYIKSNAVIPLDDLMNDPKIGFTQDDLKDIFPSFIDHYPKNGNKVYSLAFMRSLEVLYYNVDLLKAAGVSQPPASWDDFMNACKAVSKPPDTYCYELNPDASRFASWVFSRGGDLINGDATKVTFDGQPGLDALTWEQQMFQNKYSSLIAKAFQDQTDFSLGKIAFTEGSTAGLPFYDKAIKDAGKVQNWDIAPVPHTTANPVLDAYGPSVTIFKTTDAKQRAAFTFLKWLMDKDPNATWVKATGYFPARQSTKAALSDYMSSNARYAKAYDWLQYGKGEPTVAAWNPIRGFILDALNSIANNKATPADALKTAADKANQALSSQ